MCEEQINKTLEVEAEKEIKKNKGKLFGYGKEVMKVVLSLYM